jgi:hypothetical protein
LFLNKSGPLPHHESNMHHNAGLGRACTPSGLMLFHNASRPAARDELHSPQSQTVDHPSSQHTHRGPRHTRITREEAKTRSFSKSNVAPDGPENWSPGEFGTAKMKGPQGLTSACTGGGPNADTHEHTHTHRDTQTHRQTDTHTHTHTDTHTHTNTHTPTHPHTYTLTHTPTRHVDGKSCLRDPIPASWSACLR